MEDPERRQACRNARNGTQWSRATWDEAIEIWAAAIIYTMEKFGADHLISASAMSAAEAVSALAGHRLGALLGGVLIDRLQSFPVQRVSLATWGDEDDLHDTADWLRSSCWVVVGSRLPVSDSSSEALISRHKQQGGRIVNLSAAALELTRFADLWVPVRQGTGMAFLLACIHVVLKEYYVDRQVPYFRDYAKKYSNLPFLIVLDPCGDGTHRKGRFLRASDIASTQDEELAGWKLLMMDRWTGEIRLPGGSAGFLREQRNTGRWNLKSEDVKTGGAFDPLLSFMDGDGPFEEVQVRFTDFSDAGGVNGLDEREGEESSVRLIRGVPARRVQTVDGMALVTTGLDLLMAHMGVSRGLGGDYPAGYDDPDLTCTPAWQERETGVDRTMVTRVARELADNAERTEGRSLFITDARGDADLQDRAQTYRALAVLGILTGCVGRSGGGVSRCPAAGVRACPAMEILATAADWLEDSGRPSPRNDRGSLDSRGSLGDRLMEAVPEPLLRSRKAVFMAGDGLTSGPRGVLWHSGDRIDGDGVVDASVCMPWRPPTDTGPAESDTRRSRTVGTGVGGDTWHGERDLVVSVGGWMDSAACCSDMVLPTAGRGEGYDLSFEECLVQASVPRHDLPDDVRHDWDLFRSVAARVGALARRYLTPRELDSKAPSGTHGRPPDGASHKDAKSVSGGDGRGGRTTADLLETCLALSNRYAALGPHLGSQGAATDGSASHHMGAGRSQAEGDPWTGRTDALLETPRQVAETILRMSPECDGELSYSIFREMERRCGVPLAPLVEGDRGTRYRFSDLLIRPRRRLTSPFNSVILGPGRHCCPWTLNIETLKPFHTLSGRQEVYFDDRIMRECGEELPTYRPPPATAGGS